MLADTRPRRGLAACAAAALLSVLLPGVGHWAIRARLRPAVLTATVLNAVAMIAALLIAAPVRARADLAELLADRAMFVGLGMALAVLAGTRLWAAADATWQARPLAGTGVRVTAAAAAVVVVTVGVAPLAMAADYVWQTDRAIENVFSDGEAITAHPGPVGRPPATIATTRFATGTHSAGTTSTTTSTMADTGPDTLPATLPGTVPPTTTLPPTTTTTTLPPIVGENRVNVLLLGGDAGPGRWSLRTDTMVVISIDPLTGDTAMISVPRNLRNLPFPPGTALAAKYPRGFDDLANAVYPIVNMHRELAGGGDDAGAQAIKLGIAQLLGMPIHYYVLVNMAGFVDVIDALGGIDIDIARRVPSPGNPPGAKHDVPPYIEAGQQHLDGTLALAYARSRSADSDYQRMARQRCVLAAIANAATPAALATGLGDLVGAFGDAVRTDIPRERLGEFALLIDAFSRAGGLGAVRTLALVPPLISQSRWSLVQVRLLVTAVINPAAVPGGGAGGPGAPPAPAPPPAPLPVPVPAPVLADAC
ncbi:MAG: LCP family protein [Actinomycetota bacterium]|nr:LCP family protein [Actinomycetota bacterium]